VCVKYNTSGRMLIVHKTEHSKLRTAIVFVHDDGCCLKCERKHCVAYQLTVSLNFTTITCLYGLGELGTSRAEI